MISPYITAWPWNINDKGSDYIHNYNRVEDMAMLARSPAPVFME